ncbi:hypothetical protein RIR_jg7928.t1 [Rhizophagus irregularis DAOM 181602=DAOM 197198]|nr:hypothetical protein RIR_jg7928.t1 [Rhizophagus irregularis DAOM 181602=DAOM 197198]
MSFTRPKYDQIKIYSYFTKNKDQISVALTYLHSLQTDNANLKYLKTFITPENENQVIENRGSSEDLYIFVDNSNFFIEASKSIRRMESLGENIKIFIDYG